MPTTKKFKYSEEALAAAVAASPTQSEAMRKLGIPVTGSSHRHIAKRVRAAGLDTTHFTRKGNPLLISPSKKAPEEVLVHLPEGSNRTRRSTLARALLEMGVTYKCAGKRCKVSAHWNGKEILLQVDHIDGDGMNNLFENLRFLCPNCHSQTDNYAGKKNKPERVRCPHCGSPRSAKNPAARCRKCTPRPTKIVWPTDKELLAMLAVSNYLQVGKRLGVSDNAVRKHLRKRAVT
jgi:transposase-like protein